MPTETVTRQDLLFELARKNFLDFLPFVKVLSPTEEGQIPIRFELWPHLQEAITALLSNRLLIWLKSRQVGASWLIAAYAAWTGCSKINAKVLLFSQGEDEARKLLAKVRFVLDNLPEGLAPPVVSSNLDAIQFNKKGTWYIQALPSTIKAGRSETATLVVFDEADFHEYLALAYNAVKPTIDDSGGQMIMLSTSNAYKMVDTEQSLFKRIYREAPGNGFHKLFFPWTVRPGRDSHWFEDIARSYSDTFQFQKEYPSDEEEALAPPKSLMAFDPDVLDAMRIETKAPVATVSSARQWQQFSPGKRYIAATDPALGTGHDYSVTVVMDAQTGLVVADVFSNTLGPNDFVYASVNLLSEYDNPTWAIEANGIGRAHIDAAIAQGYSRLYYRDNQQAGWHTSSINRESLWNELIYATQDRAISIPAYDGLQQFYQVIRNPKKDSRVESDMGGHDDYPTACAIAWKLRRYARKSRSDITVNKKKLLEKIGVRQAKAGAYKW